MAWVKMDDKRATNAKLRAAGFEARGLDEAAICWCAHEESDGFVSDADLMMLAALHGCSERRVRTLAASLVDVGRWARDDNLAGHWVHDFLDYNPSRDDLAVARRRDRERKRNPQDSARNPGRRDAESANPVPSRPDRPESLAVVASSRGLASVGESR